MGVNVTAQERNKMLEQENRMLGAALEQAQADLDFVAIMADIDLDDDDESEDD